MAILFAALRALTNAFRILASLRAGRAERKYETIDKEFRKLERDAKADEVQVGRPVGYAAQLKLLQSFETKERARERWMRAVAKQRRWQRRADRVAASRGTVAPYLLGLVDASLIAVALHHLAALKIDVERVQSLVALLQTLRS